MSIRKITELPTHVPEDHGVVHIATFDTSGVTRRLNPTDYVFETEQEAIDKIRAIYKDGFKAFVMKFKV